MSGAEAYEAVVLNIGRTLGDSRAEELVPSFEAVYFLVEEVEGYY